MGAFQDLTGMKFNRLTVIELSAKRGKHTMWLCKCDCGNMKVVRPDHLKSGLIKSCGCIAPGAPKHRMHKTRLYHIWDNLKMRCYNPNNPRYRDYGGRGVEVCDSWKNSFEAFRDWAISNGYSDLLTIDRIDNNGGYSPENCRWVTQTEQQNNKRSNHIVTYNGESHSIAEWSRIKGLKKSTLYMRLCVYNWPIEKALKTP